MGVSVRRPVVSDGARVWELARDAGPLDLNSPYYYLVFCSRFAGSSVVAELDGRVVGFVTGARDPEAPGTLFVWQVGVDVAARGRGVAGQMLDALLETGSGPPVRYVDTTVTPSNEASMAMFESFARRHGAGIERSMAYRAEDFPAGEAHEPERLLRIGPFGAGAGSRC